MLAGSTDRNVYGKAPVEVIELPTVGLCVVLLGFTQRTSCVK